MSGLRRAVAATATATAATNLELSDPKFLQCPNGLGTPRYMHESCTTPHYRHWHWRTFLTQRSRLAALQCTNSAYRLGPFCQWRSCLATSVQAAEKRWGPRTPATVIGGEAGDSTLLVGAQQRASAAQRLSSVMCRELVLLLTHSTRVLQPLLVLPSYRHACEERAPVL